MAEINLKERSKAEVPRALPLLWDRRSMLAFDSRPVERSILRSLLEAASLAPSSMNEQPWRFWVGSDDNPEFRDRLRKLLVEGNSWAKEAPVLILSGASRFMERNGSLNFHAKHDLGAANLALMLQATFLGLDSHPMGGFDYKAASEITGEAVEPVAMIAVGYPGDPEALSEMLRVRHENRSARKPVEDFVRYEA